GGYGSDIGPRAQGQMGFTNLANVPPVGALVLAPTGAIRPGHPGVEYWNADPSCCDVDHVGNDDVAYLGHALIDEAIARGWHVDRSRVFVVGRSNGGFMAERLACDRADVVTAIVDLAGQGESTAAAPPASTRPVHALIDHSLADTGIHYDAGTYYALYLAPKVSYVGTLTTIAQRAAPAGCTNLALAKAQAYDHDSAVAGNDTDRLTMTCTAGSDGAHYEIEHWRE